MANTYNYGFINLHFCLEQFLVMERCLIKTLSGPSWIQDYYQKCLPLLKAWSFFKGLSGLNCRSLKEPTCLVWRMYSLVLWMGTLTEHSGSEHSGVINWLSHCLIDRMNQTFRINMKNYLKQMKKSNVDVILQLSFYMCIFWFGALITVKIIILNSKLVGIVTNIKWLWPIQIRLCLRLNKSDEASKCY